MAYSKSPCYQLTKGAAHVQKCANLWILMLGSKGLTVRSWELNELAAAVIRQPYFFVSVNINSIKLTQSDKVSSHKNAQFLPLSLSLLSITGVALVLYPNPKFIHLSKV